MSRNRVVRLWLALGALLIALPVCSGGGGGGGIAATGCPDNESSGTSTRDNRAIAGVSMGGYGALNLGTKRQDFFGVIGSMGGPVDLRQLLRDIRDDNLEVKPQAGAIPINVGDDFTFDLLPTYPDRETRIGFTKDLVLAFGNPTLHHPDPDFAYLASDSEPAMLMMDDEWGAFVAPAGRGFQDGGDDNENGVREVSENTFDEFSDALLLAGGTLFSEFGIVGTDVGGRMLADDGPGGPDGIYDIGDGIVVNLSEPFTDANGNGVFDTGEAFDDFGLDGVPATGDFGEGNGTFQEDPDIPNEWIPEDPLTRIQAMSVDNVCSQRIYMDAGTTDELNFLQHHRNVQAAITAKGLPVTEITDGGDDDCVSIPQINDQFSFLIYDGGHVGFDTQELLDDLQSGDVCGSSAVIWQRLLHLLVAMSAGFKNPVVGIPFGATSNVITASIPSPALAPPGGPTPMRDVVIYEPPDTSERLPIVYFLGGYGQKPEDFERIDLLMDFLILNRIIQNMYIAFLPGEGGTDGSFYVNHTVSESQVPDVPTPVTDTSGRYEDSIFEDLIPEIEDNILAGRIR